MRSVLSVFLFAVSAAAAQGPWHFVVSGDSRNCGDVVMPAIAKAAAHENAAFYWHLGDFRAIYLIDQDYAQIHNPKQAKKPPTTDYLATAWQDFIAHQLKSFGETPVFLAFGNHELIPPMTSERLIAKFGYWLDMPVIARQRLKDDHEDEAIHGYYHWVQDEIDFITLDNAANRFDSAQLMWLRALLERDTEDASIRAVVTGMHEALPESISKDHSMNQTLLGDASGLDAYHDLLDFKRKSGKPVYVLASHSHYYMPGIYDTAYWRSHGGVLPGWIVGTAGAERYKLPPGAPSGSKEHVYGYLEAIVSDSKEDPIHFEFHELKESDVPQEVQQQFTPEFVHACWVGNPDR